MENLPFEFNKKYGFVIDGETYIKLAPKEIFILETLLKYPELCKYSALNAETAAQKAVIRTCVSRLNKKLSEYIKISAITNEGYVIFIKKEISK